MIGKDTAKKVPMTRHGKQNGSALLPRKLRNTPGKGRLHDPGKRRGPREESCEAVKAPLTRETLHILPSESVRESKWL